MHNKNNLVISFFGPPGSGKGTLAEKCIKDLGFIVLSTGALCRKHVAAGSTFGKMLDNYLKTGQLVPDSLISSMVEEWLYENFSNNVPIILDGYPRTLQQAKNIIDLKNNSKNKFEFKVIVFDISFDEIIKRLSSRLICSNQNCQAIYSTLSTISKVPLKSGICDLCGSPLIIRNDDKPEVILERLKVFELHKNEILQYYNTAKQEIITFKVEDKSPQEVFDDFVKVLKGWA